MSTLRANSIEHTDGGPITLTKQSAAKTWCSVNSTAGTIRGSFNVSSMTDEPTPTGVIRLTTTAAFDSTDNMSVSSSAGNGFTTNSYYISSGWINNTSNYYVRGIWGTTGYDILYVFGQIHGDLA